MTATLTGPDALDHKIRHYRDAILYNALALLHNGTDIDDLEEWLQFVSDTLHDEAEALAHEAGTC